MTWLVSVVPCPMSTNNIYATTTGRCAIERTNTAACNYIGAGSLSPFEVNGLHLDDLKLSPGFHARTGVLKMRLSSKGRLAVTAMIDIAMRQAIADLTSPNS